MRIMLKSVYGILLLSSVVWVFLSCEKMPVYEKSYAFDKHEWSQQTKPVFQFQINDTSKEYDFLLTVRTTTDYKYNNLWVYLNTKTPDGKSAREPFEIKIANPDGSWTGKKTGSIVENTLYFKRRKMPLKGAYIFQLEQGVTQSHIDQILDIGLLIQEGKH
jgi:gliding motility-associated lipoprotein GldH